jgi:hypothetical protein
MLNPLAAKKYEPWSDLKVQSLSANATPDKPNAIAAATKLRPVNIFMPDHRILILRSPFLYGGVSHMNAA